MLREAQQGSQRALRTFLVYRSRPNDHFHMKRRSYRDLLHFQQCLVNQILEESHERVRSYRRVTARFDKTVKRFCTWKAAVGNENKERSLNKEHLFLIFFLVAEAIFELILFLENMKDMFCTVSSLKITTECLAYKMKSQWPDRKSLPVLWFGLLLLPILSWFRFLLLIKKEMDWKCRDKSPGHAQWQIGFTSLLIPPSPNWDQSEKWYPNCSKNDISPFTLAFAISPVIDRYTFSTK